MKTKVITLVAVAMLSISNQAFGQTDTTKSKTRTISHSHTHTSSSNGYSYEYNYDYNYDMPNYPTYGGIRLSTNFAGFVITDAPNLQSNLKAGLSFGGFMKVELSKNFALQYELLCIHTVSELKDTVTRNKNDYSYLGFEFPIYAIGQLKIGTGKGFIGVGPYAAVGLSSLSKPGNINLYKKNKATGERAMNRWDVGFGAIFGYELKNGFTLNTGYQFGFINMLSAQRDDFSMTTIKVSLGIAYKF